MVHCGGVAVKRWWRALAVGIYRCPEWSTDGRVRCPGVVGPDGICDVCGGAS